MSSARFIVGDTRAVLQTLPDASVDLVMTSPPFLALRSYLPADHPDKAHEIGSEPTPAAFIDTLLDIAEECRRVLAPHGSLVFELGDTYSGSGGAGGDYGPAGLREGQQAFDGSASRQRTPGGDGRGSRRLGATPYGPRKITDAWPLDKSLTLVPESFRWALAYGRNPFNGRTTPPWRVRNVVRWHRPNPPVGALGDKFRPSTSEMVVACTARDRYFDLDAVRHAPLNGLDPSTPMSNGLYRGHPDGEQTGYPDRVSNPAGAPPLDTWVIPTHGYPGAHYATYPEALCVIPIKSMCPELVCRTCGLPSRRIMDATVWEHKEHPLERAGIQRGGLGTHGDRRPAPVTTGWTDCGHDDWRPGVVLDPFAGSGTTLAVAVGHGRDAIGIDLDERNAWLARERVGMFLEIDHGEAVA